LSWAWPVTAPVVRGYGSKSKGVDFRLKVGDTIRAAAAGEVVYAGNGLGRYAHLVIIKHNDQYLSAYSLDSVGIVREGQRIKAGGNIADVSLLGRNELTLHFEIRRNGEAVDPRALIVR
jgi:lipoprotein NlpD